MIQVFDEILQGSGKVMGMRRFEFPPPNQHLVAPALRRRCSSWYNSPSDVNAYNRWKRLGARESQRLCQPLVSFFSSPTSQVLPFSSHFLYFRYSQPPNFINNDHWFCSLCRYCHQGYCPVSFMWNVFGRQCTRIVQMDLNKLCVSLGNTTHSFGIWETVNATIGPRS